MRHLAELVRVKFFYELPRATREGEIFHEVLRETRECEIIPDG